MLTIEQSKSLTEKYVGQSFSFHSTYDAPGWKEGDTGTIIKLYHPEVDKIRKDVFDLWQAKNERTNEVCDIWACEMLYGQDKHFLIIEQINKETEQRNSSRDNPIDVICPTCKIPAISMNAQGFGTCKIHGQFNVHMVVGQYYRGAQSYSCRLLDKYPWWE
jgi:hypothetical protein